MLFLSAILRRYLSIDATDDLQRITRERTDRFELQFIEELRAYYLVPDSFLALDHMLRRFTGIVRGLVVHADRMRANLESTRGLVFSGRLLVELTARGMAREEAYRIVQAHAMEAWKTEGDFRARVSQDPAVRALLKDKELAEIFRSEGYLKHVDAVFARVFAGAGEEPWPGAGG